MSSIDGDWSNLAELIVAPGRCDVVTGSGGGRAAPGVAGGRRRMSVLESAPPPARAILRSTGFLRGPEVRLLARGYGDDQPDLRFLRDPRPAVHVTYGDSDHV